MIRMPFGVAITFNIILLLAAFNGMLGPGGIFILIINIILTIPALLRYIEAVGEKKALKKELKELERAQKIQTIKIFIDAMIRIVMSEETSLHDKITALVVLNDFFVVQENRKYIYDFKDDAGNLLNEYTMCLFISNHSERLMTHPQTTNDLKEILEKLSYNRDEFATKRLKPILKQALEKIEQENKNI